jgi:hypothetical protein
VCVCVHAFIHVQNVHKVWIRMPKNYPILFIVWVKSYIKVGTFDLFLHGLSLIASFSSLVHFIPALPGM